MIKTAAQILAEINELNLSPVELRQREQELQRPLVSPVYPGQKRRNVYPVKRKPREPKGRLCSVPDCTEKHQANDYCSAHNYRYKTYGSPFGGRVPAVMLGKIEGLSNG